jgi:ABC-type cobalt transport system substrate-binding protein
MLFEHNYLIVVVIVIVIIVVHVVDYVAGYGGGHNTSSEESPNVEPCDKEFYVHTNVHYICAKTWSA